MKDKTASGKPVVRTTIVGGGQPGSGRAVGSIPRGVEVLIKKASIDGRFCKLLLKKRSDAATVIGLVLDPTEEAMLDSIPRKQLEAIIAGTKVSPNLHSAFLGYTAAVMLAALGCSTPVKQAAAADVNTEGGARPDIEHIYNKPSSPFWQDAIGQITVKAGVLSGTVSTSEGTRLANSTIHLSGDVYNEVDGKVTTIYVDITGDDNGLFLLNPAPAGTFTVSGWAPTYMGQTKEKVVINAGALTTLGFVLTQASPPGGARPDIPLPTRGISPK